MSNHRHWTIYVCHDCDSISDTPGDCRFRLHDPNEPVVARHPVEVVSVAAVVEALLGRAKQVEGITTDDYMRGFNEAVATVRHRREFGGSE